MQTDRDRDANGRGAILAPDAEWLPVRPAVDKGEVAQALAREIHRLFNAVRILERCVRLVLPYGMIAWKQAGGDVPACDLAADQPESESAIVGGRGADLHRRRGILDGEIEPKILAPRLDMNRDAVQVEVDVEPRGLDPV